MSPLATKQLILVGDSDIAFWPKDLLPKPSHITASSGVPTKNEWGKTLVSGHPGASLADTIPHLRKVLEKHKEMCCDESENTLFVVACAGENDIGEGLSLEKSVHALREFLEAVFDYQYRTHHTSKVVLIFLGPKFEPWLEDDPSSKKLYATMSRAFERRLQEHQSNVQNSDEVHFVDCLTMFCGETANLPGARIGGRASAEEKYFASDRLHLSRLGYATWNDVVEGIIRKSIESSPNERSTSTT